MEGFKNILIFPPGNFSSHLTQLHNFWIVPKDPNIFSSLLFSNFVMFLVCLSSELLPILFFRRALVCLLEPILPAVSLGPCPWASLFSHSAQICSDPDSSQQHFGSKWPWASQLISWHSQILGKRLKCRTEIWKDVG